MQFVGREVFVGFQKCAQDGITLLRVFQAHPLQMTVKDTLSFADHLLRDAGLVIDSFLQGAGHSGSSRIPVGLRA